MNDGTKNPARGEPVRGRARCLAPDLNGQMVEGIATGEVLVDERDGQVLVLVRIIEGLERGAAVGVIRS